MGQCIINRTNQPLYWGDSDTAIVVDQKALFPVGAVYQNTSDTDPSTIITDTTWTKLGTTTVGSKTVYVWERTE